MMMNRLPREVASVAVSLLGLAFGSVMSARSSAATSPLQAQAWDMEMTVPAGAYRASKTIEVKGDFTEKIERGAFLDGVTFATRGGVQHWKIEGALLRKIQVTGKRDSSLHAADTVLEDFGFSKDDNWYNFWWSTRSTFENCIFTKRFLRGDLPPLDYAARATRCTFYGVNLPSIGMKENPAGYLQKENMRFVKCRFIQCDVPETFLAATVDCVFEGCRFQGKRHDWPKETSPIKVNAYYTGLGAAPKSFINGPLTVQFTEAPKNLEVGSTLPHTYSGGRVNLANLRDPGQYMVLGSVSKKASEIPPSEEITSSLPPKVPVSQVPSVVPGISSDPNASPAGRGPELNSMAEVLRLLPVGIELLSSGQLNVAGMEAANQWLENNMPGRAASMRMTLDIAQAYKEDGYAFKATGRSQPVTSRGLTIPAQVVAYFHAGPAAALARVSKGRELVVRGVVQKAILEGEGRSIVLTVTLKDAAIP